jgi:hypothetical protein
MSPNAAWQTLGITNEVEFCFVNAVPHIEYEYRVLAFNLTGDIPGAEIVRFALEPEVVED